MRDELIQHNAQDRLEFTAIRSEHAESAAGLKLQIAALTAAQHTTAEHLKIILTALGLSAPHDHKGGARKTRRKRPVALMGSWEMIFKIGGSIGGLMLIWKMLLAALPGFQGAAIGLWHALQAINHVATQ